MKSKISIEDTAVVPYIIADRAAYNIMEQDNRCKKWEPMQMQDFSNEINNTLCERAERHYQQKGKFYKDMNNKRKDPRYHLEMFMEHWCKPLLDLYIKAKSGTLFFCS